MGEFFWLIVLSLLNRGRGYFGAPATALATRAQAAQAHARRTAHRARQTGKPEHHAEAARAATHAAVLTTSAATKATHAASAPPPWPTALPAGLPPWPSGWEADNPPPPAVVTRAWQLLPILWKKGQGTKQAEFVGGRWIMFVAQWHGSGVKGVTAFRPKLAGSSSSVPARAPGASAVATLRQGSTGPAVVRAQELLGVTADGKFGPQTKAAVVAFQAHHGLAQDGVIGPATWAELARGHAA